MVENKYKTFTIQLQLPEYLQLEKWIEEGRFRSKIDAIRFLIRKEMLGENDE
ncbi:MAG: hypothetical protein QW818_01910 [Candidatus Aenigmatarchaeota archaeon]|nr:hypothetical protein [Candidatus Aenigmarchaeota archaeon]